MNTNEVLDYLCAVTWFESDRKISVSKKPSHLPKLSTREGFYRGGFTTYFMGGQLALFCHWKKHHQIISFVHHLFLEPPYILSWKSSFMLIHHYQSWQVATFCFYQSFSFCVKSRNFPLKKLVDHRIKKWNKLRQQCFQISLYLYFQYDYNWAYTNKFASYSHLFT